MHINRFKEKSKTSGFALPSVLIASIIMLTVLLVAVTSTAAVRSALAGQYYNQLSQAAADAGIAYAQSCLDANNGVPLWSDAKPLMPNTDCTGTQLTGFTCPSNSVDARCSVMINGNVKSSFSVGLPTLDENGKATVINPQGSTSLLRESTNIAWRTYIQKSYDSTSFAGIVTPGLTVSLDAGDPLSYPGSGLNWSDLSGSGNRGVLVNGPTYSSNDGGYLSFDGSNDYVNVGNLGAFYNQGTISFWMNPTVVENYRNPFTTNYNGGGVTNTGIRFEEYSSGGFHVIIGDDAGTYSGGSFMESGLSAKTWYHVTLVWDKSSNNIKGYINGVEKFDQSQTLWPTQMPAVTIGEGFSNTRFWKGYISDVQIYNRGLSTSEVEQNFNALSSRYYSNFVDLLIVGGGGGGGGDSGGGGGAGALIYNSPYPVGQSGSIPVIIGAGGTGSSNTPNGNVVQGSNGGNSLFGDIVAVGGGGGGAGQGRGGNTGNGLVGGSGGGGGSAFPSDGSQGIGAAPSVPGQGYPGASGNSVASPERGGGGGGAGGPGVTGVTGGGAGGPGLAFAITGSNQFYAAGGGGGSFQYSAVTTIGLGGSGIGGNGATLGVNNTPTSGVANTGSGGGSATEATVSVGGNGGSGVVIIRYPTGSMSATGGTITTVGGYTIHKFTSNGVFTVGGSQVPNSCSDILSSGFSTGDGIYWIYPNGTAGIQVYCDMTNDGGGWTLVLQNNASQTTPSPNWSSAVNGNNISVGSSLSYNLSDFDVLVGLGYWNSIGAKLRAQVGTSPTAISHKATYDISLNAGNFYALTLSNQSILLGGTAPGIYVDHNGKPFTTYDADHDSYGANCSALYANHPWWYGACWGGNFFAGGAGYQEAPYWTGSTTDYYAYGSLWLK